MLGIFTGVIANSGAVLIGTAIGLVFAGEAMKRIGERIFQAFMLFVMVMGVSGALYFEKPVTSLVSIMIGTAIGEILDIDAIFNRVGERLEGRFAKDGDGNFTKGFMQASLIFCVGSMTVLGAMESGIGGSHSILFAKSVLDGTTAAMLSMGLGIGVAFSAITVLVYEGLLVLGAGLLSPIMDAETLAISTAIGSLTIIGIALNGLKVTKLKVANFLPAMFIPIIWRGISILINRM